MSREAFQLARDQLLKHREDYDRGKAEFRWPKLSQFNWALDWFDGYLAVGPRGNRTALKIVGTNGCVRTFRELSEASNRLANGLRGLGVQRGDCVLLMLGNCPALWEIMLACMKLGAVTIPASTLLTAEDVRERMSFARVDYWITDAELAREFDWLACGARRIVVGEGPSGWVRYDDLLTGVAEFRPDAATRPDEPMLLYFTSGTTTRPKLVSHSHRSFPVGNLSTMYWLGLQPGDIHVNVSSPGWAKHAWSCLFAPWNAEATVFIPNLGRFNPLSLLETLREGGVTSLCAPPTVWRMLIQEDLAPYKGALNNVCAAGEPLNPEVIETVQRAWGLSVRDGFGQTETTAQIGNTPGQPIKPGSVGRPLPGFQVLLLDSNGLEADEGEICLRLDPPPDALMLGYRDEAGVVHRLEGSAYRTGDLATRDADGYFTYLGRADDVFKASDYRISPFELESALIEHIAIAEAAVVPAPDPVRLAIPKAYVVLAAGVEPCREIALAIFLHIQSRLAPYKRIRRIEFAELPKTISGKIRRAELRRREIERHRASARGCDEYREEDFPELLRGGISGPGTAQ
jgi:acetyl-CoA synthetase